MDDVELHDLTAAYALDALDADEVEAYEAHLTTCQRCRAELAVYAATAESLAFAVPEQGPPPQLRERILAGARADRPNVGFIRPRRAAVRSRALAAIAVAAVGTAIGLGVWDATLHNRLSHAQEALRDLPLTGANGSAVVAPSGRATLVIAGLGRAPRGKTYEAWVIQHARAKPAGLFGGGSHTTTVPLSRRVPHGALIAVTVEPESGSPQPTAAPIIKSAPF